MFKAAVLSSAVGLGLGLSVTAPADGKGIADQYIIRLQKSEDGESLKSRVEKIQQRIGGDMRAEHVYSALAEYDFLGFSAFLTERGIQQLLEHTDVLSIEQDQIVSINDW